MHIHWLQALADMHACLKPEGIVHIRAEFAERRSAAQVWCVCVCVFLVSISTHAFRDSNTSLHLHPAWFFPQATRRAPRPPPHLNPVSEPNFIQRAYPLLMPREREREKNSVHRLCFIMFCFPVFFWGGGCICVFCFGSFFGAVDVRRSLQLCSRGSLRCGRY